MEPIHLVSERSRTECHVQIRPRSSDPTLCEVRFPEEFPRTLGLGLSLLLIFRTRKPEFDSEERFFGEGLWSRAVQDSGAAVCVSETVKYQLNRKFPKVCPQNSRCEAAHLQSSPYSSASSSHAMRTSGISQARRNKTCTDFHSFSEKPNVIPFACARNHTSFPLLSSDGAT